MSDKEKPDNVEKLLKNQINKLKVSVSSLRQSRDEWTARCKELEEEMKEYMKKAETTRCKKCEYPSYVLTDGFCPKCERESRRV